MPSVMVGSGSDVDGEYQMLRSGAIATPVRVAQAQAAECSGAGSGAWAAG